jgi:hypothetical protein
MRNLSASYPACSSSLFEFPYVNELVHVQAKPLYEFGHVGFWRTRNSNKGGRSERDSV